MTVTHSKNTPWADSATDEPQNGGLNEFGEEVIIEMNRLGMLVDLSHVSEDTMRDAFRVTRAPVIFSHSGAGGITGHPRNVPDVILPLVKRNRGVIMVVVLDSYTSPELYEYEQARTAFIEGLPEGENRAESIREWDNDNPKPIATMTQVADHIDHIRDRIGVEHEEARPVVGLHLLAVHAPDDGLPLRGARQRHLRDRLVVAVDQLQRALSPGLRVHLEDLVIALAGDIREPIPWKDDRPRPDDVRPFRVQQIADERDKRLIFFGRHAGYAGMINTLWALARPLGGTLS